MKNFLLGVLTVIVMVGIGTGAYFYGRNSLKNELPEPLNNTVSYQEPTNLPQPTQQIVGNDRDEHGCIGSAGYTWCEIKKKCLRSWEEACETKSDNDLIKEALFKGKNWNSEEITVRIKTNDGHYASGSITAQGGGGYFFAAKVNGNWEIVAEGNGTISCSTMAKYPDFPNSLIPECYNETTGKSVKR